MQCEICDALKRGSLGTDRMSGKKFVQVVVNNLIEYETPRYVKVHNLGLGCVLRSSQLLIILYVVLYAVVYQKGYQEFANIESSVITKVKGTVNSNMAEVNLTHKDRKLLERVWDEADYVIPPAENGAFFVTTNVIVTPNQTQGRCPEEPDLEGVFCEKNNNTCVAGTYLSKGHGILTGACVSSDYEGVGDVCEVEAWCPLERIRPPQGKQRPILKGADKFTVFMKNSISFRHFGPKYRRNNVVTGKIPTFYHPTQNPLGQIFNLGEIVSLAGGNFTTLSIRGGVIAIHISWFCNLDFDFQTHCLPDYSFSILEDSGWNFRHAYYHELDRRTLFKAFGLKFQVVVDGRAGKFSIRNLLLNLGNGLALLGLTTLLCEFVLLYFVEDKQNVALKKYDYVHSDNENELKSNNHFGTQTFDIVQ